MSTFKGQKWKLFISRPTSILKRDFLKWTYLSLHAIDGFALSEILALGSESEMNVYLPRKEDERNYRAVRRQYVNGSLRLILSRYRTAIAWFRPRGDAVSQSLAAMQTIGPLLIYTYYVERLLDSQRATQKNETLRMLNAHVRDEGAKLIYPLYDVAYNVLSKKYAGIPIDQCTLEELTRIPSRRTFKQRTHFFVYHATASKSAVYTGSAAKHFLAREKFKKSAEKYVGVNAIRGVSASPWHTKGEVKVVHSIRDLEGCSDKVIVAPDTIIEYTPYLRKQRAIVTDFGGLSSHAAVIAREFRIPCIVGTKIATKILKDGDMVEVNANTGVVKRIL